MDFQLRQHGVIRLLLLNFKSISYVVVVVVKVEREKGDLLWVSTLNNVGLFISRYCIVFTYIHILVVLCCC